MSGMDPFGNTYPSNGFKSRGSSYSHSSDGGLKGLAGTVTGVAKDVGAQLSSRGRSWSHIGGYLGAANTIYGGLVVVWALIALLQHGAFALGLGLGIALVLLGLVGMVSMKKDAHSMRTLYLSGAVVVGLLSWAFVSQVGYTTRNDCVLAETFLRLDHLENAVHKMKHEDMIKGIMMRLDSMQTEMAYLEEHAEEKVAESARRQQFKENDLKYLDMKLVSLGDIAERSLAHLDERIAEINRNVTTLEAQGDGGGPDAANLKARLRSLRYRQRTMQPRKDKLREVLDHVEEYRTSSKPMTEDEYETLLKQLEIQAAALDGDLQQDIADTRQEADRVAATAHRLEQNVYVDMRVGNFAEREKTRTDARQKSRDRYEAFIGRIQKERDATMGKKELYVRSLNRYLESMPEHCMDDLEEMHPGQIVGAIAMALGAASAYVALTATVMSVKKDY